MPVSADAALRMLRERGRQLVARGMGDWQARVNDELFALVEAAADPAGQSRRMDALRIWHAARRSLAEGFAGRVDLAFRALRGHDAAAAATAAQPAALRLMDDHELADMILADAMAASAAAAIQQPLAELSARLETLIGVRPGPREIPLAPEFLVTALAQEIAAVGLVPEARQVLLRAGEATLLRALPEVVQQANQLLRDLGVGLPRAAEPEPVAPADTAAGGEAGPPQPAVARGPDPPPAPPPRAARRAASRRLLATLPPDDAGLQQDDGAWESLAELLTGLVQVSRPPPGQRPGLLARARAGLAQRGLDLTDLHPLDRQLLTLVDTLFAAMAEGAWVPPQLDELLGVAEVPVAELAGADPAFLDKPWHPGRRLLNEIIGAATDYLDQQGYADQELFRRAAAALESLGRLSAEPGRLAQLLAEFIALVEREQERTAKLAERALREAAARERTELAHRRVAEVLNVRLADRDCPLALVNLLERAWCRVLFLAWFRGGEGSAQWRTALHLLDQLLGLLGDEQPDAELAERLWAALAERLEDIAFDSFEARALLADLRACLDRAPPPARFPPATILTPDEARELGDPRLPVLVDTLRLALPGAPEADGAEPEPALDDVDLSRADSLRVGSWIEFDDGGGERIRARLLGVVQPSGTHLLGSGEGGAVRLVPKRRLALALKEGRLIALDNSRLFEQALERALGELAAAAAEPAWPDPVHSARGDRR